MSDDPGPLYAISVETLYTAEESRGLAHCELAIQPSVDPTTAHGFAQADLLAAYRWLAGIITRAALGVSGDLSSAADEHGCSRWINPDTDACGIFALGVGCDLGSPNDGNCGRPCVLITAPAEQLDHWRARIEADLGQLIAEQVTDVEQPDEDEQHAWLRPQLPHQVNDTQERT